MRPQTEWQVVPGKGAAHTYMVWSSNSHHITRVQKLITGEREILCVGTQAIGWGALYSSISRLHDFQ